MPYHPYLLLFYPNTFALRKAFAVQHPALFSQGFLQQQKGFAPTSAVFSQGFLQQQKGFCRL